MARLLSQPDAGFPGSRTARPRLVAVIGPTATGKSRLALALAGRFDGEIVNCDSTACFRDLDIGTDKVPLAGRHGIPHHLLDLVDPTEAYSAARFAEDAARVIRDVMARGRLPIVAGGTGLYYRALFRGLFPGPGRDPETRARLGAVAERYGPGRLHRWLGKVDPESAARIAPRDVKRLVRALEVFHLTRRPLSAHFAETRSPIEGVPSLTIGLRLSSEATAARVAARVDAQFAAGLVEEVRALLRRGVPADAQGFGGLVYREVVEMLQGVRDEAATRELIVRENRRYARRQRLWFQREPGVHWLDGPGEEAAALRAAVALLSEAGLVPR